MVVAYLLQVLSGSGTTSVHGSLIVFDAYCVQVATRMVRFSLLARNKHAHKPHLESDPHLEHFEQVRRKSVGNTNIYYIHAVLDTKID